MSMPIIKIFGDIGDPQNGITAKQFQEQLDALGDVPEFGVRIASDGGSVPEGIAIHNAIANHPARTVAFIESALSIASYIAIAADEREMAPNGMMMVHGARADMANGTESDYEQRVAMLRTANQSMRQKYTSATGKSEADIAALLAVDTWMDAQQALAEGFVTRISGETSKQVGAGLARALERFPTMPPRLVAMAKTNDAKEESNMSSSNRTPATVKELKAAFPKAKAEFILAQAEKESTVEEARASYVRAMEEELEQAHARIKAMEEEKEADASARAMEEEEAAARAMEEEEKLAAMEEEESKARASEEEKKKEATARARAKSGTVPVARARGAAPPVVSARARWNQAVDACVAKGMSRQRATIQANRENPGLREELLAEANG